MSAFRRCLPFVLLVGTACGKKDPIGPPPGTGDVEVEWAPVVQNLNVPIFLTSPPGDSRWFVAQQGGVVRVVQDGQVLATPFIDISGRVLHGGERGLLGMAFHPDYATNGYVFLHYSDTNGDTQIDRYTVSNDPNVLSAASRLPVLSLAQPYSNHNGGMIAFGPDGMFYVALGDGGSGGDPLNSGQSPTTLLGSILRIDVDGGNPYGIPADNPFVGTTAGAPEVWAYGLRNPWRFSFDVPGGRIYIADVGQNSFEEIDVQPLDLGGINYGWNIMEGNSCYNASSCNMAGLTLPVLDYPNPADGCAVVGGYVYRGSMIPELQGHYFYSDACAGWLRSFLYDNGQVTDEREWPVGQLGGVRSFGTDADGELYIVAGPTVYQLVPVP